MDPFDDVECLLSSCVLHNAHKHGVDHHDAVNIAEVRLKTGRHEILASRFIVEDNIEGTLVCHEALR